MGEDSLEDPVDLAKRARKQSKHAVKNATKAGRVAAEPALNEAKQEAKEVVSKLENTADDAFKTAKRFNPRVLGSLTGDAGQAFLAFSVACYAATLSANKFRAVYANRGRLLK